MIVHRYHTDEVASDPPAYAVSHASRKLTSGQVTAIRDAMHIFVEDDLAAGVSPHAPQFCPACDAQRPLPGFVRYEDAALCNACATDYEIARTSGLIQTAGAYIDSRKARAIPSG